MRGFATELNLLACSLLCTAAIIYLQTAVDENEYIQTAVAENNEHLQTAVDESSLLDGARSRGDRSGEAGGLPNMGTAGRQLGGLPNMEWTVDTEGQHTESVHAYIYAYADANTPCTYTCRWRRRASVRIASTHTTWAPRVMPRGTESSPSCGLGLALGLALGLGFRLGLGLAR